MTSLPLKRSFAHAVGLLHYLMEWFAKLPWQTQVALIGVLVLLLRPSIFSKIEWLLRLVPWLK